MIAENDGLGESETDDADRLRSLAPYFDTFTLRIGPAAWVSAVVPGTSLLSLGRTYPEAALPASGRVANGCGLDPDRCRTSGLGEAVELASCCAWGDEPLVRARAADLPPGTVWPQEMTGLTAAQTDNRQSWNRRYGSYDWRPPAYGGGEIEWIAGTNAVSGAMVHLPADGILIGRREPGDEAAVAIADSNGCAAGATSEKALEAALLELIERDATGRWWYGRRRRPELPFSLLESWPDLCRWLGGRARSTRLLDLTTDIGIPVVAAVSTSADGGGPAIGVAARLAQQDAAGGAVAEMLGVETSLLQAQDEADPQIAEWLARGPAGLPRSGPVADDDGQARPVFAGRGPERLIGALDGAGCRVIVVDLSRPMFGVPVMRAVSPELCHCKPRFARDRLLAPDARDLAPARSAQPNPVPLLI